MSPRGSENPQRCLVIARLQQVNCYVWVWQRLGFSSTNLCLHCLNLSDNPWCVVDIWNEMINKVLRLSQVQVSREFSQNKIHYWRKCQSGLPFRISRGKFIEIVFLYTARQDDVDTWRNACRLDIPNTNRFQAEIKRDNPLTHCRCIDKTPEPQRKVIIHTKKAKYWRH